MNFSRSRAAGLAAACLALLFSHPLPAATAYSLLPDGDFDKPGAKGDWPLGWSKAGSGATWETEDNNRFIRLTSLAPGRHIKLFETARIPAGTPGFDLSMRVRVRGLQPGEQQWYNARVIINFVTADGKRTASRQFPQFSRDTDGWQSVTQQIVVPPDAVAIEFMPSLFKVAAGTMDLDDIILTPVPAEL